MKRNKKILIFLEKTLQIQTHIFQRKALLKMYGLFVFPDLEP